MKVLKKKISKSRSSQNLYFLYKKRRMAIFHLIKAPPSLMLCLEQRPVKNTQEK